MECPNFFPTFTVAVVCITPPAACHETSSGNWVTLFSMKAMLVLPVQSRFIASSWVDFWADRLRWCSHHILPLSRVWYGSTCRFARYHRLNVAGDRGLSFPVPLHHTLRRHPRKKIVGLGSCSLARCNAPSTTAKISFV